MPSLKKSCRNIKSSSPRLNDFIILQPLPKRLPSGGSRGKLIFDFFSGCYGDYGMTGNGNNPMRKKWLRAEYSARINRVLDFIDSHFETELSLKKLAEVADFSPYHFHRIFHSMVGETLNQFIQRIRLEKAATLLISNPKEAITDIAFDCGFSGSAAFARAFKESFKMNASQWRNGGYIEFSKIGKLLSKNGKSIDKNRKDFTSTSLYNGYQIIMNERRKNVKKGKPTNMELNVQVKEMPEIPVAYVRHIGPYQGDVNLFERLFTKLFKWAGARDLLKMPETRVLAVYHDNPEITDDDKLRLSVCISVPEGTEVEGDVGYMVIPGGKFALGRFELGPEEYQEAWDALYGGWLPESGFQPADGLCYEWYHNDCREHPQKKSIVDICVPVKPL
jgi:AraC family transcriptional regulator